MTIPTTPCGNVRIGCSLCDFVTESIWIDEAVRELRDHAKTVHKQEMTYKEAAALIRGSMEKTAA